ncbi:MAG: hypothetical protein AAGA20_05200 [Planctomycetota bacterium]
MTGPVAQRAVFLGVTTSLVGAALYFAERPHLPTSETQAVLREAGLAPRVAAPVPSPTGLIAPQPLTVAKVAAADESSKLAQLLCEVAVDVARLQIESLEAQEEEEDEDEAAPGFITLEVAPPPLPPSPEEVARVELQRQIDSRRPMAPANVRARSIARTTAVRAIARATSSPVAPPVAAMSAPVALATNGSQTSVDDVPEIAVFEAPEAFDRSILFVWSTAGLADADERAALISFAMDEGFDGLAVEATAVGYGSLEALDHHALLAADARASGIEVYALIGYPWFTVPADAGLPGQPTSSEEGLALIETLVASGVYDGLVEDSQPYGAEYDVDGQSTNWLFDETQRATDGLAAYLRAAKDRLGDLELIKTTPFWFDSDARLGSLAEVVAEEIDLNLVLAYRDSLDGPNGILELVAGEAAMGPMVVAFETSDLGSALDFLTYHEEGYDTLVADRARLSNELSITPGFRGTAIHYYGAFKAMARTLEPEQPFGFFASRRIRTWDGATIDSYDSRIGDYSTQVGYDADLDRFVAGGDADLFTDHRVVLRGATVVNGDVHTGSLRRMRKDESVRIDGEVVELAEAVEVPSVELPPLESQERFRVRRDDRQTLVGDHEFDKIVVRKGGSLVIEGPATIRVRRFHISRGAAVVADVSGGPVEILISGNLTVRELSWMAPTDLVPGALTIRSTGRIVRIRDGAMLVADVLAPNGNVHVGRNAHFFGRSISHRLTVREEGGVHLDMALRADEAPIQ